MNAGGQQQTRDAASLYPHLDDSAPVPDLYPTYDLPPPQQQAQVPSQHMAAASPYQPVNIQHAAYAQAAPTGPQQPATVAPPHQVQQPPASYVYGGGGPQSGQPAIVAGDGVGMMGGGGGGGGGKAEYAGYDLHANAADPYWKGDGEAKWEGGKPGFVDPQAPKPGSNQGSFNKPADEAAVEPVPYQDRWAAFLFLVHVAVIAWMAFDWGLPLLEKDVDAQDNANQTGVGNVQNNSLVALVSGGTVCTLAAAAISYMCLKYVLKDARNVIKATLIGSIVVQVVTAVLAMLAGQLWLFVMGCIFALVSVCYFRLVRNRIAFASTNLAVATAAIGDASGPVLVSFGIIFVQLMWQFVWTLAMMGALLPQNGFSIVQGGETYGQFECENQFSAQHNSYVCVCAHSGADAEGSTYAWGQCKTSSGPGFLMFLLLISAFWGSLVLQYLVHCTAAGVVAEWWFTGAKKGATWASFKRATTTSFGSICFGALFLSVIRAVHQMLLEMRKSENNACVCFAECLLQVVESVATYFNRWVDGVHYSYTWYLILSFVHPHIPIYPPTYINQPRYAFTYVAMYGTSFVESGKDAVTLFKQKGLSALINDQLVSNVFMFASFGSAVLTALVGYGYALAFGLDGGYKPLLAGVGFIMGLMVCSIVLSIMDSAVATVFVCWAEAKEALQRNDANLYAEMDKSWAEAMTPMQM